MRRIRRIGKETRKKSKKRCNWEKRIKEGKGGRKDEIKVPEGRRRRKVRRKEGRRKRKRKRKGT